MEDITILCYPKCSTCRKAEQWLKENGIEYNYRLIRENNPTEQELTGWIESSGMPVSRFFNTSGLLYREHNIKDKLRTASRSELVKILASDGMMVKRPVVLSGNSFQLIGFNEKEWKTKLTDRM